MNCMFSLLSSSRQSVRPNCQVINYSECRPRNSLSSSYAPELSRSSSQFTLRLCFVSYHLIPLVKLIGVDGRNFSGPFHFRFRSVSKNLDRIDFKIGNQLNTVHMSSILLLLALHILVLHIIDGSGTKDLSQGHNSFQLSYDFIEQK